MVGCWVQPTCLVMLLLVLWFGGTHALTNADGSVFRLNMSVPAMDRLNGATINAIGLCWGGWAPCWNKEDVRQPCPPAHSNDCLARGPFRCGWLRTRTSDGTRTRAPARYGPRGSS